MACQFISLLKYSSHILEIYCAVCLHSHMNDRSGTAASDPYIGGLDPSRRPYQNHSIPPLLLSLPAKTHVSVPLLLCPHLPGISFLAIFPFRKQFVPGGPLPRLNHDIRSCYRLRPAIYRPRSAVATSTPWPLTGTPAVI